MTIKERMDKALEMAGQTKGAEISQGAITVSYTHLRAHET